MPVTVKVNFQLFPLWLYPLARNALKGFGLATNEKSAIVKANGNPAIVAALDNIANFTLQRHFGFPRESTGDQHDLITNLKTGGPIEIFVSFIRLQRRHNDRLVGPLAGLVPLIEQSRRAEHDRWRPARRP